MVSCETSAAEEKNIKYEMGEGQAEAWGREVSLEPCLAVGDV